MANNPRIQTASGQCGKCGESDRLTTAVLSKEPINGDAIDPESCIKLCPRCYMMLTEADGYHLREFPIDYLWDGTEQCERDDAGDRRTILNPANVDEWISVKEWVEVDVSECQ